MTDRLQCLEKTKIRRPLTPVLSRKGRGRKPARGVGSRLTRLPQERRGLIPSLSICPGMTLRGCGTAPGPYL